VVAHSEQIFTDLRRENGYSFGFWGLKKDAPWVEHIGLVRTGYGY
jgi:hypothetical protein